MNPAGAVRRWFAVAVSLLAGTAAAQFPIDRQAVNAQVHATALKFAPILRFDSGSASNGYPMSAQDYYAKIVATSSRERLQNTDRNTLAAGKTPVYYHASVAGTGQMRLRYWIFFGYQEPCFNTEGAHNGDWENVTVILTEGAGDIAAVVFGQHGGHYTRIAGPRDALCTPDGTGRCSGSGGFQRSGTHPIVYVGRIAHGFYHDASPGAGFTGGNCGYYLDPRDGKGPSFETANRLVSLAGPNYAEPWMAADHAGGFNWGHNGVTTHPTTKPAPDNMPACTGTSTAAVKDAGCYMSECLAGDDQAAERCFKECEPGYTNVGLTCNKGKYPWEWKIYGRLDSGRNYGYGYTIPKGDVGLKRRRSSGGDWNIP